MFQKKTEDDNEARASEAAAYLEKSKLDTQIDCRIGVKREKLSQSEIYQLGVTAHAIPSLEDQKEWLEKLEACQAEPRGIYVDLDGPENARYMPLWGLGQKRRHSLAETILSTAIGFVIALIAQREIFPLFGFAPPLAQNLEIAAIFTVISVARGYFVRRLFNWLHEKEIL